MCAATLSAREWLGKLISFDTTSTKPNMPLIEHVAAYLRQCRVTPRVMPAADGIHANLMATLPAADGSVRGGLILSGHTDVVPVTGQKWDSNPFKMAERDGKLYGRGACDMKAFIAVCLSLVPTWLQSPPDKPVHIVLTYNEEVDFAGITQLMKDAGSDLSECEGCIVGEPTMLEAVIAHKGISSSTIYVTGKAAHSSLPMSGCNAVEGATRIAQYLFSLRDQFMQEGPFEKDFEVSHTSLCPSIISGGIAMNTIPEACELCFEIRNVPSHDPQHILQQVRQRVAEEDERMKRLCPTAGVTAVKVNTSKHFLGDPNASVVKAVLSSGDGSRRLTTAMYCTEAGEYQALGVNTVVCGPGSIDQAHRANEFVSVEQLDKGTGLLQHVVRMVCGGSTTQSHM